MAELRSVEWRRIGRAAARVRGLQSPYDVHIAPYLGDLRLVDLTPEVIARWRADRVVGGAGRVALLNAMMLLGAILQRAAESGRISRNPARLVRKVAQPARREVRPLAPVTVEALRAVGASRDATLLSVLAYAVCDRSRHWGYVGHMCASGRCGLSAPCRWA